MTKGFLVIIGAIVLSAPTVFGCTDFTGEWVGVCATFGNMEDSEILITQDGCEKITEADKKDSIELIIGQANDQDLSDDETIFKGTLTPTWDNDKKTLTMKGKFTIQEKTGAQAEGKVYVDRTLRLGGIDGDRLFANTTTTVRLDGQQDMVMEETCNYDNIADPIEEPVATPEPTATPAPTATPEPTATPAPTATPEPTAVPAPSPTAAPAPPPPDKPEPGEPGHDDDDGPGNDGPG